MVKSVSIPLLLSSLHQSIFASCCYSFYSELNHDLTNCTIGRLIIWTESAFKALNDVFGTLRVGAKGKTGYHIQRPLLTNPDIAKIINSNEIQSVVRNQRSNKPVHTKGKKNPLTNHTAQERLNPYAKTVRDMAKKTEDQNKKKRQEAIKARRGISAGLSSDEKAKQKQRKTASKKWINQLLGNLDDAYAEEDGEAETGAE